MIIVKNKIAIKMNIVMNIKQNLDEHQEILQLTLTFLEKRQLTLTSSFDDHQNERNDSVQ